MTVGLGTPAFANDGEGNNSFGSGPLTTINTDYDGRLRFNGGTDDDWYRIQLPANGKLVMTIQSETPESTPSTIEADLYYTSATFINGWSGPTGTNNLPNTNVFEETCRGSSGGQYYLRLRAIGGCEVSYRLTISLVEPAFANDPNTSAFPVAFNTYQEGQLNFDFPNNTLDYYAITPPMNGVMSIEVHAEHAGTSPSTMQVQLRYTSGSVIQTWTVPSGANGAPITTVLTIPCRGNTTTYHVYFTTAVCGASYRFKYTVAPPFFSNDTEPNNSAGQSIVLPEGQTAQGHVNFDTGDNTDSYRADLSSDGVMNVTIEAEHADVSNLGLITVELYVSTGVVLETWTAPVGASLTPITTSLSKTCRGNTSPYYLRVSSNICGTSYRIGYSVTPPLFSQDAEPNNTAGASIVLPETQTAQGHLNFFAGDNTDSYRANLSADGVLNVTIEAEHADVSTTGTIEVELWISNGTVLQTWTAPVGANSVPISTTLSKTCRGNTSPYYLRVSSDVCGTSYRISYSVTPPLFAQDTEPNQGTGQAIVLPETQSAEGHLNFYFGDNEDNYRADLSTDGVMNVIIEAEHADVSTTGSIEVELWISNGTVLETWTVPVGANSIAISTALSKTCRGNGLPYYLRVSSDVCGTSYRISYSVTPPLYTNDPEPNNSSPGTPMNLDAEEEQGHIGFYNTTDDDYYGFTHGGGAWSVTVSAEHAETGDGTLTMEVRNNPGTLFGSFTVPVGGSSTPLTNTFTIPSLAGGSIYRLIMKDATCGVSYRIHCYDDDNDGTCNDFDLCTGGPEPGTPCDDGSACTTNDVIQGNCTCAGTPIDPNDNDPCTLDSCDPLTGVSNTFQDADNDGTCDANDLCPGGAEPGTVCNDNDPCTIGDVIGTNCLCAGTYADADADGTCDANDLCTGGPEPGTSCNDNNGATINDIIQANCLCAGTLLGNDCEGVPGGPAVPGTACNDNNACTTGDVYGTNCLCAGTFADADNDGTCDANDLCPGGPEPGTLCDDGNPATTNDLITASCVCAGVPVGGCDHDLTLEFQTDGAPQEITWEIRSEDGNTVIASGGPLIAPNGVQTNFTCLTDGCFTLRVLDSAGDGMTTGGYILRTTGTDQRIIDNRNNFSSGSVSAISGGQGFCLPLSNDKLSFSSCDKLDWKNGQYVVASPNPAVSAEWIVGGANSVQDANSGYEFWIFDPNGSYSFRRFRSHTISDGFGPASATRACHMKLNNWTPASHVPANVLMNVRVRARINGNNGEFGPACRLEINPVLAACPQTKLMDIPGNQFFSCGATRQYGAGNYVHARPVSGANRYQFRFRLPAEGFEVVRTATTYFVQLNWTGPTALQDGKTYDVDVRISKDAGLTWCTSADPWGEVCLLTIDNTPANTGDQNFAAEGAAELRMFPNPNRGDLLNVSLSTVEEGVNTVSVDIYDLFGKRVSARTIVVTDGHVNTILDLNGELAAGMYLVNITAGETLYTERLVIQP
jgi:hypothetical protein